MKYGHAGKILNVDLTKRKFSFENTMDYAMEFLGGLAINAKILWDQAPPKVDPLSPENCIIFGAGPLAGTMAPGSGRTSITAKSALTNMHGTSNMGGDFSGEMKFAGYDHIVLHGRAEIPSYLWIDDELIELRDARGIWGRDAIETQELIQEELGDPEIKVACIGQAGENRVRLASIISSKNNAAAREGIGAVMGAKNMKAIAVRGTGGIEMAKPDEFYELAMNARRMLSETAPEEFFDKLLLVMVSDWEKKMEVMSYGNFEGPSRPPEFENIDSLREEFGKKYWVKNWACFGCPAQCYSVAEVPDIGIAPAMCSAWHAWGRSIKVPSLEENWKFWLLVERYGIDVIGLSNVLAFGMDLYEKGIITAKDTDGIKLKFGDAEAALKMTERIALREGFGDVLAEGVKRAAARIGKGSEYYAHHVKGLEMDRHDPRAIKGAALSKVVEYKVNAGDNYFEWPYVRDVTKLASERLGTTKVCDPHAYEDKHLAVIYAENISMMSDIVGICRMVSPWTVSLYGQPAITPEIMATLVSAAAFEIDVKALFKYTEKCKNIIRAFDAREGLTRKDEILPKRLYEVPIPKGIHKGQLVDSKKFEEMLDDYYISRGWNVEDGLPTRKKLEELDLKAVADQLEIRRP